MRVKARSATAGSARRAVRVWLLAVAALVFAMVVVGGATRLTGSGLSITEWQPIVGTVPPLTDADWQEALAKYRATPQYQKINRGMSLADFKRIFWWEWAHRFLGRGIGFAFAVPFLYFLWRGTVRGALAVKLAGVLALGALQGAVGWYMVASGLVVRVDVSPYRLAAHLTIALAIFAALLWIALSLADRGGPAMLPARAHGRRWGARLILLLVFVQTALGGLVAGAKAGLSHNTWPLMDGHLVPPGLFAMTPWYTNIGENVLTVQFNHRLMAYLLAGVVAWQSIGVARSAGDARQRRSALALAAAVAVQIGLGIWTLVEHVPLGLGLLHQAGAVVVLAASVWHLYVIENEEAHP